MEPIGEQRLDLLFAMQQFTMYLLAGGKEDAGVDISTFLPPWWTDVMEGQQKEPGEGPTREQLLKKMGLTFAAFGGVDTLDGTG